MNPRISFILTVITILFISSCSSDDDEPKSSIDITEFTTSVTSRPDNGEILGNIIANTSQGDLTYSLTSQTLPGTLAIDPITGELTVNDHTLFDIQNNPVISGTVTVTNGISSNSANLTINLTLSPHSLSVISYFQSIALGFEFGSATEITRRWESKMTVFVGGNPTSEHLTELNTIVDEINALATTNFSIETVNDSLQSNYYVYFGSASDYASIFPSIANLVNSNLGLFSIFWNGADQLIRGNMYVDIFRANLQEQKHLLREELTQSLGLAKDSPQFSESIFQQSFSTKTTQYAQIDMDLIRLLYHSDMSIGLNRNQVGQQLKVILESEWQ